MKIRTLLVDIVFLMVFLAGSVYSYSKFKSSLDYAHIKQKLYTNRENAVFNSGEFSVPGAAFSAAFSAPFPEGPVPAPRPAAPAEDVFFYNGPGCEGIRFAWRPDASFASQAARYTFRISARPDLRRPLVEETVDAPFFFLPAARLSILPETAFYWGVSQTDCEGERSPWSEPRRFITGLGIR